MNKLKPMDIAFLMMENDKQLMHMAAFQLFQLPKDGKQKFINRVLDTFRNSEVCEPFNQKLKWLSEGVASWEKYEPDLKYHVRHISVPKPGRLEQFYELISFINTPQLDRAYPLWECYVIEGIENDSLAIFIKIHHSLVDGEGGLRLFRESLSLSPKDKKIRAIWTPNSSAAGKPRTRKTQKSEMSKLLSKFTKLPAEILGLTSGMTNIGAQAMGLKPKMAAMPFGAKKTIFNRTAASSARRYANCELPFDEVKAVSKATGCTINDVIMAAIDAGLHSYLSAQNERTKEPLVAMMAMSLRTSDSSNEGGNQVCVQLIQLGEPQADIMQRLLEISAATQKIKSESQKIPASALQLYTLLITGGATLADMTSAMDSVPSSNLTISNMVGPREQLYLAGAPMIGFHGLPIVPPGSGLNVTFASVHDSICLGIGATPEAVNDPFEMVQFILESFYQLQKVAIPTEIKQQSKIRRVKKSNEHKVLNRKKTGKSKTTSRKTT